MEEKRQHTAGLNANELNILKMCDEQERSAANKATEELLAGLVSRGLLRARSQGYLNGNAKVGDPSAVSFVKFYRTTAKGRAVIAKAAATGTATGENTKGR